MSVKTNIRAYRATVQCENNVVSCNDSQVFSACFPMFVTQVEVEVRVRGSTEIHRGDMELLPLRDVSMEGRGDHWDTELRAVLGPLCFL